MSKLVKKALMVLCAGAFSASVFAATQAPTSSTQGTAPQAMATSGNSATPAQKKMMHKHHQRMKACMKQGNSKKACKKSIDLQDSLSIKNVAIDIPTKCPFEWVDIKTFDPSGKFKPGHERAIKRFLKTYV